MKIKEQIVEVLAIKLYEHDHQEWPPAYRVAGWMKVTEENRELYRQIARGNEDLPEEELK